MDENKTAENKKPNIVEIAKKKRHLYLYEKLHSGTPFTPAELKELERLEAESDLPNGVVDTKEKVAKALNVSVRTVYYWAKEGMPVTPEGHYDLLEIKAWRMTQQSYRDVRDTEKEKWDIEYRKNKALYIKATIYVLDKRYKKMLIGKQGRMVKEIGMATRKELELSRGQKVFLDLKIGIDYDLINKS